MTNFQLHRNPHGQLVCTDAHGQVHVGIVPVRAFPITAPDEGLSLVAPEGHEVAWIDRLQALAEPTRALIEEELAQREFMPEIMRLVAVSSFATPSTWQVETDRGPTQLVLKGEEDIRRLPGGRLLIADRAGVSFLIRDPAALDRSSRRLLDRFL
ncbi:DUF1854 domain-containing protein [Caldimonas caldifontis]|uniref:DUF1854 domain-containing protein n=1 Tax=Caldimonas caldifontis TaxID=1452508 RepID=A0A2S5SS64_9BURK|nr:DUF1854 domain-containing protein [Caldimonas caldifontis]PPE65578.1 DUF1854 domain-containing protein [Caldimonas caldifontis]